MVLNDNFLDKFKDEAEITIKNLVKNRKQRKQDKITIEVSEGNDSSSMANEDSQRQLFYHNQGKLDIQ